MPAMEAKVEPPKRSIEEVLSRLGPFFIVVMSFPLTGMVAAIGVLVYVNPPNLPWLAGLIVFFMAQYILTMVLMYRKMKAMGKANQSGGSKKDGGPKV